ncbi:MAG: PEP-CTERM sorting domain-containing protein, partial [Planctomycetes bacterium]|nr:PEP-CTERM sorting domain-containing protein [Planctomycetota bacterium]
VNTGANDVTVSDGCAFSAGSLKISGSGAPFTVGGDNMAAGPPRLGLSGGTVTVSAGGGMPSGLAYHIDASDAATLWQDTGGTNPVTVNGQLVARWDDKSASGINVSEGNTGDQPEYRASVAGLNNMPALFFDGDVLRGTNDTGITGDHDLTMITVWSDAAGTGQNYQHTVHMGNTGTREAYGHSVSRASNGGQIGNHYWGDGWDSSSTNGLGAANIALSTYDSGADQDIWWVNGDAVGSYGVTLNIAANQLQIGSRLNPVTEGFRGNLAEVLIFDQVLTSAQMNDVGGYLAAKYGINAPNWTGSLAVPPINLPDTDVAVSADATLNADTPLTATFGDLDMAAGADLTLTGAPDGFSFNDISGGHSVDGGAVTARSGISPGVGVESDFRIGGDLTLANAATYDWDLGPDADADGIGEFDTINVSGDLTLGDWTLALHDLGGEAHEWDPLALFIGFTDVTWDPDLVSFDMTDAPAWLEFTQPEDLWVEHLLAGPRGEGLYLLGLQTVPEPSTIVLMLLGGLGLLAVARRRRKA